MNMYYILRVVDLLGSLTNNLITDFSIKTLYMSLATSAHEE